MRTIIFDKYLRRRCRIQKHLVLILSSKSWSLRNSRYTMNMICLDIELRIAIHKITLTCKQERFLQFYKAKILNGYLENYLDHIFYDFRFFFRNAYFLLEKWRNGPFQMVNYLIIVLCIQLVYSINFVQGDFQVCQHQRIFKAFFITIRIQIFESIPALPVNTFTNVTIYQFANQVTQSFSHQHI